MPRRRLRNKARAARVPLPVYQLLVAGEAEEERDRRQTRFFPHMLGLPAEFSCEDPHDVAELWRANREAVYAQFVTEHGNSARTRRAFLEREQAVLAAAAA